MSVFFHSINALQQSLAAQTLFGAAEQGGPDWKAGWVGWMGYGMKEETLAGYGAPGGSQRQRGEGDRSTSPSSGRPPDACLSFVRTVLALDHTTSEWLAIGLVELEDTPEVGLTGGESELEEVLVSKGVKWANSRSEWDDYLTSTESALKHLDSEPLAPAERSSVKMDLPPFKPNFSGDDYIARIGQARNLIHSGESYELTLTTQFRSTLPPTRTAYDLYLSLRSANPAPYSTYLDLPELGTSIVSSSPERFMKVGKDGTVEMKPIKGTVARVKNDEQRDEQVKMALQHDRKEIAENLMVRPPPSPVSSLSIFLAFGAGPRLTWFLLFLCLLFLLPYCHPSKDRRPDPGRPPLVLPAVDRQGAQAHPGRELRPRAPACDDRRWRAG